MGTETTGRGGKLGGAPSFNRPGWCLLDADAGGVRLAAAGIRAQKGDGRPEQLLSIAEQFNAVMQASCPSAVYFERPGAWQRRGGTRRETVEALAMSRAVMLLGCAAAGVAAYDADVHVVRQVMFGRVNASSLDVLESVRRSGFQVPVRPRGGPDMDIANAIVIGLYALSKGRPRIA